MLTTTNPAILYFGTPVVLVSSINADGSANLAPMSSAWWLGWRCMLGFGARSATPQNILRTGECVLNLPSANMALRRPARPYHGQQPCQRPNRSADIATRRINSNALT